MTGETRLEKIADEFIEIYMKDHPVMIYSLHAELEEYIESTNELKTKNSKNKILQRYSLSKTKRKEIDNQVDVLNFRLYGNTLPGSNLSLYTKTIADPLIRKLVRLVMTSNKVKVKSMDELENAEQEDPLVPNEWIYHKDLDLDTVLMYIRNEYDTFRKQDEIEDGTDPMA